MSACDPAKWSCPHPGCDCTCTCYGSPDDVRTALTAVQEKHGKQHARAARTATRHFTQAMRRAG